MSQLILNNEKVQDFKNQTVSFMTTIAFIALICVSIQAFLGQPIPIPESKKSQIAQEVQVNAQASIPSDLVQKETSTDPAKDKVEAITQAQEATQKPLQIEELASKNVKEMEKINNFLAKRKNAYTKSFINQIFRACGSDYHSLRLVIAVSGSETAFGTLGSPKQGFTNNFWGWGYNSKTKSYMKGSEEQMAKAICAGFSPNGRYYTLVNKNNGKYVVRKDLTVIYSGNDNADTHAKNTLSFYLGMV